MDSIDVLIAYEQGLLSDYATINMFAELIRSGICWQLQGHYGRTAKSLIDNSIISKKGKILQKGRDIIETESSKAV